MTVKELKEELARCPDNMDVYIAERKTEFAYGLVNSAYIRTISFQEEPDEEFLSNDSVFILDEE